MSKDTILDSAATVEIAGVTYTLRRLGLQDVFRVARILGGGVAVLGESTGKYTSLEIAQVLIAAMTRNEDEVLNLVADLLNVERKTLADPDKFPMDSMIDIIQAVSEHQDLKAFLSRVAVMMDRLPEMKTA
jgi:hypothetical protein